jgi:hypothetical protein
MTGLDVSAPEITSDDTRQRYELEEMGCEEVPEK